MARTSVWIGIASIIGGLLLAAPAARARLTKQEFRCEIVTDKTLSKVTAAKTKCILKCARRARKGKVPQSDCEPPYGHRTLACIADATDGVQVKAAVRIAKTCAKDCPECYTGGCAASGAPKSRVAYAVGEVDMFVPLIGCEQPTNKRKAKCIDGVAKAIAAFTGLRDRCYQKCALAAFRGQTPPVSCRPPAAHPDTVACLAKAETKTAKRINKVCFTPPAQAPSCYDGTPPNTAAGWIALGAMSIDGDHAAIFCASPSGAFLH